MTELSMRDAVSERAPRPYRKSAPNIVVIVLDDLGFAQAGCYGSDLETPNLDRIAERGIRFTNFHTTAICSPTRACLLTGRNHHRVGMGMLPDLPVNFPGYTGTFPDNAATIAEILKADGYVTSAIGKWHLTARDQRATGPYDMWPTGVGFEHYYGFLNGETNQWTPNLIRDQQHVEPPATPDEGYHLDANLADEAIHRLRQWKLHQPDRPFFLWYATAAPHAPHQAPPEWIDRFAGHFDGGWDDWRERTFARQKEMGIVPPDAELSARPDWVEAWSDIDPDRRRLYARMMEVYAGFLAHADHHIGRVLDAIEASGQADDTIVAVISDNGCSAEGGPNGTWNQLRHYVSDIPDDIELELEHYDDLGGHRSSGHYPWGWAFAGNTPFRRWKRYTFEGGVRDPLIVSWPARLSDAAGSVRDHYVHAVDIPITLLELAGLDAPNEVGGMEQMSFDGTSFASILRDNAAAPTRREQYYECWGSRAIYADGWKAVTNHVNQLTHAERTLVEGSADFNDDQWLLFHTDTDFAEVHDLAGAYPERLEHLVERWHALAMSNQVLPIDDGNHRISHMHTPWLQFRRHYELAPGDKLHEVQAPVWFGGFRMAATFGAPLETGASGVIAEQGDWNAGWAWFLANGTITWVLALNGSTYRLGTPIPAGARAVVLDMTAQDQAFDLVLQTDTGQTSHAEVAVGFPRVFSPDGSFLTVGYGRPFPVCDDYVPPAPAPATLQRLTIDTGPQPEVDFDTLLNDVMRHQ